jgi:hypothetical protein
MEPRRATGDLPETQDEPKKLPRAQEAPKKPPRGLQQAPKKPPKGPQKVPGSELKSTPEGHKPKSLQTY